LPGVFITGTDTGVGKTLVSVLLLKNLQAHGVAAIGMKPVASGCDEINGELINDDALMLLKASVLPLKYAEVNPYAYREAVSPHIAARQAGQSVEIDHVLEVSTRLRLRSDFLVVEGIGGWETPLNEHQSVADLALALDMPVVMVVPIRLGCISHAVLTESAVISSGCHLSGWIANFCDPSTMYSEEIYQSLCKRLLSPAIGKIPMIDAKELGNSELRYCFNREFLQNLSVIS